MRALRDQGVALQQTIHEDMRVHFAEYSQQWGLRGQNRSIDRRRVPNQMRWFEREGWSRPTTVDSIGYTPGDIAAWKLSSSGLLHIGIVSECRAPDGTPLIIHNIGNGRQEDDILFRHAVIGHCRPVQGDSRIPSRR